MTLKTFLKDNYFTVSKEDRSRLGHFIHPKDRKFPKTKEDGCKVNDYPREFLYNENTQKKVIEFFSNR